MTKFFKFLLLFIIVVSPLNAISADEILENFGKTLNVPTIQGSFKVSLISQNGDVREIEARAYQKLNSAVQNDRLFIFDFPPTVRGTGLLINSYTDGRDNNMWIYLPTIRRIKRIALESSGGGYFMGSDFTYQDLISNDYSQIDYELQPEKVVDGFDCYVVKAWGKTPDIQQENGYSYFLSHYRKDNFLMIRREFYDFNGDLLKIYEIKDFLVLSPYMYPTIISMTNVQSGHQSLIEVTDISTDAIPDSYFTTRFLKKN